MGTCQVGCVSNGWPRTARHRLIFGQTGAEQTWNLLDEGFGCDEGIVLASQLLDKLLVLVELLQVVRAHGVNAKVLSTIDIVLVTEYTDAHSGARDTRKLDSPAETLVTLGVIVFKTDLKLDSLLRIAMLVPHSTVLDIK